jgi:DNA-binding NtrC family response regulator
MPQASVVLLDVRDERGCASSASRLAALVHQAFAPRPVAVAAFAEVPPARTLGDPDAIFLHAPARRRLPPMLRQLRAACPSTPLLAATCGAPDDALDLERGLAEGVDDFLCCPFSEVDLLVRLRRLLPETRALRSERGPLLRTLQLDNLVGESRAFVEVARRIPLAAASSATVLIGGETGAGKGLFARAVHYNGARRAGPFIPVNCSAIPDHLFENELFGHARGAYTDAGAAQEGLLAQAEGGTLFLDEVETLAATSQAKLLRLVQDHEYRPLGSAATRTADVRIIAATNAHLPALVAARRFREDLFHRLDVLSLTVPPLRERASDIPLLARHFLGRLAAEYGRPGLRLPPAALRLLLAHRWPGNVRELEARLQRAVVFSGSDELDPRELGLPGAAAAADADAPASLRGARGDAVERFERGYLQQLLADHGGNVSHAARAAGSDRRTFQRLLRKHGIDRSAFAGGAAAPAPE